MQGSIFRIKNSCCFLHYLKCAEYKLLALVVMKLLLKYDYYIEFYYGKLTIGYVMKQSTGDVSFLQHQSVRGAVTNMASRGKWVSRSWGAGLGLLLKATSSWGIECPAALDGRQRQLCGSRGHQARARGAQLSAL